MRSVKSLVMSDKLLNQVGDHDELETCCQNVLELDLSKNEFNNWNEVYFYKKEKRFFQISN